MRTSGVWGFLRRWTQLEPVLGQSHKTKGQGTGGGHRTEGHQAGAVTEGIDSKIPSWQQDLREDDLPYQHTPFPDSACLGNNGSDCSCTRGGDKGQSLPAAAHQWFGELLVNLHWLVTPKIP